MAFLTVPVPEPGSISLLVIGFAGLLIRARRKQGRLGFFGLIKDAGATSAQGTFKIQHATVGRILGFDFQTLFVRPRMSRAYSAHNGFLGNCPRALPLGWDE
jgi:hypothetical protein